MPPKDLIQAEAIYLAVNMLQDIDSYRQLLGMLETTQVEDNPGPRSSTEGSPPFKYRSLHIGA